MIVIKLFGICLRFFQVAINKKILNKIMIRKNDKNGKRSLIKNKKSISFLPLIVFS